MVTIVEKPKEGKEVPRSQTIHIDLAEKILNKSRGWELPKDSPYVFKDGTLTPRPTSKPKKKDDYKE